MKTLKRKTVLSDISTLEFFRRYLCKEFSLMRLWKHSMVETCL